MENAPEANPGKYPQTPSIEVGQGVSMGDIVSHGPFIFMNIVGSTFIFNIFLRGTLRPDHHQSNFPIFIRSTFSIRHQTRPHFR